MQTNQEFNKRAVKIELVKNELRMVNQANPKKRWSEKDTLAERFPNKKSTNMRLKFQGPIVTRKHCTE